MKKWKTLSGEILNIKDMGTSHINNCIKMLKRLLASEPMEAIYTGDSEAAEQAVDCENNQNHQKRESINETIDSFKSELRLREAGKPIGEDYPLKTIQRWEVERFNKEEFN